MKLPFLNRRITPLLPITIVLFLSVIGVIALIPPMLPVNVYLFTFPFVWLFFPLVFLLFFGIGTLIFKSRFHGLLLAICVILLLLLRINGFKHPLFSLLLIAIFIALEFFFAPAGEFSKADKKTVQPHAHKDQVKSRD